MLFVSVIYGDGTKLNGYLIDTNMLHVYEYDFSRLHFAPYRVHIVKLKQPHDETIEKASLVGTTLYDEFYLLSP